MNKDAFECRWSVLGDEISFCTNSEAALRFLEDMKHIFYIRDFEFERLPSDSPYRFIFLEEEPSRLDFDPSTRTLRLHEIWDRIKGQTTLRCLALLLTEVKRQSTKRFMVHASAVELNGRGAVLVGPTGAGKTSLALDLCLRHGFRLLSADWTIVGQRGDSPFILGGSKVLNLRLGSLRMVSPELAGSLFSETNQNEAWNVKHRVQPQRIGIAVCSDPVEMAGWFTIGLDSGWQGAPCFYQYPSSQKTEPWVDKAAVAEELARFIRGSAFCLLKDDFKLHRELVMPLLDSPLTWSNRTAFIENLCDRRRVYVARGRLKGVADKVASVINV